MSLILHYICWNAIRSLLRSTIKFIAYKLLCYSLIFIKSAASKCLFIHPFKPYGASQYYQLDKSISVLRLGGCYFSFLFKFKLIILQANSGDPYQMPHSLASDLGLHCLSMS